MLFQMQYYNLRATTSAVTGCQASVIAVMSLNGPVQPATCPLQLHLR